MKHLLESLVTDGVLDEVLGQLKSGKEAEVYRVVYRGEVVAAKVYKARDQRSFQHNSAYKEGRSVRNTRTQRAMDKGSRFGRSEDEDEWKASEARCLHTLHAAGVRVPVPVMFYEGVLMMQLVTDADGDPAPRLIDAQIAPDLAMELYRDVRGQIVKMLCCDLIHGDLSPYNVLLAANGPTIIDFPQTLSAAHNSQSERFFRRDFDSILNYFAHLDGRLWSRSGDGGEIWRAYVRRELTPDFVPLVREARASPPGGVRAQGPARNPREQGPRGPAVRQGAPLAAPAPRPAQGAFVARPAQGPIVTYARRRGDRESAPTVAQPSRPAQPARNLPPSRPVIQPRDPPAPDGNPHRRRKHKGS